MGKGASMFMQVLCLLVAAVLSFDAFASETHNFATVEQMLRSVGMTLMALYFQRIGHRAADAAARKQD